MEGDPHHFRGASSSLRSDTGLEDELDESCGGDVEDEMLPELVDDPGTTRGTKVSVLHLLFGSPEFSPCVDDDIDECSDE